MQFPTITMKDLEQHLDKGTPLMIVDLRNRPSYDAGHIKSAISIPYSELDLRVNTLPKDRPLVFYCYRGGQSMLACNHLAGNGFQVVNVANGITFYQGKYLVRD